MNINATDNQTGRRVVASIDPITGGAGGNPFEDGSEGSGANSSFLKNTPVEINEAEVPIRILRYGLLPDSGGPGKFRGGLATILAFRAEAPNTRVTARNRDRTRYSSWGARGGRAGTPSIFLLNPGKKNEINLGNTDILTIGPGDEMLVASGGAGGWGDPLERNPDAVLLDVKKGFVTVASAERDYGVVLANGGVAKQATVDLRESRINRASNIYFDYGAGRDAYELVWTEANYAVLTAELEALPAHWRFFVKHRVFEAMEALNETERKGDGTEVRKIISIILENYPQLRSMT